MNNLKQLKSYARKKFWSLVGQEVEDYDNFINNIITHTYETAIKDCLAVLPELFSMDDKETEETMRVGAYREAMAQLNGYNRAVNESRAKLESLLPNNK